MLGRATMPRTALVGRDGELATLAGWLDAAGDGEPRLVLCGGGPGVGRPGFAEGLTRVAGTATYQCCGVVRWRPTAPHRTGHGDRCFEPPDGKPGIGRYPPRNPGPLFGWRRSARWSRLRSCRVGPMRRP